MHTLITSYNNTISAPLDRYLLSHFISPFFPPKTQKKKGNEKMKKKRNKPSPPLPLPSPSDKMQPTSTSSSFSSFSSTASTFPSPSLSPYHFSSSVPFSWERKPGVPFTPLHPLLPPPRFPSFRPLPLPPSKVKSIDGNLATIRRRRKGFEVFLALIGRLAGLDPYRSCKSVASDDVTNREAKTSWSSRRRHKR